MEYDLKITKKDDVYMQVACDQSISHELRDYFSFMAKGFQFNPKYKAGMWDGRIRLFKPHSQTMYSGLIYEVIRFCVDRKYKFHIGEGFTVGRVDDVDVDPFIESLNLPFEPYDYQIDALKTIIKRKRRLVLSPTSSGKSLIIYMAIRSMLEDTTNKVLLVVPSTSLVEQMFSDFDDYAQNDSWSSEEYVHKIYDYRGMTLETDKPIVVSTWQSVFKLPKKWFDQFDACIVDEAHQASAKSLMGIMEKLRNAPYKVGLTGTIDDTETHRLTLQGLFGKIYQTTTVKDMTDAGRAAALKIKGVVLEHPPAAAKLVSKMKYDEEIDYLVANETRNKLICNLATKQSGNVLVLFRFVEKHGKVLEEMIAPYAKKRGKTVLVVHGQVDTKYREQVRRYTEENNDVVILASFGTFSTGVNIKNLHYGIFAHPYKAKIKTLQSIGRLLRLSSGGNDVTLFDIADNLKHGRKTNITMKHFIKRLEIYDKEQHDYDLTNVKI